MTRRILFMVLSFGIIFGCGIGAIIEHHFNRVVVVMSPICHHPEGTDHSVFNQQPDEQRL